ncbi:MAG TPA: glycine zipper 2TM domain-containing protein [Burkholderiaceae bacterium]|nr:glycine zipper 2TM domain-containing protein [Burkholderiaceae bacterium]
MKTPLKFLAVTFSMLSVFSLGLFTSAHAQQSQQYQQYQGTSNTPRIEGFNVDEVPSLRPGTELDFSLYGTPGGTAMLRIAGSQSNLLLRETEAGQYEGTYTISSRDNITARSSVTANLRVGNQVTSMVLSESLQAGVGYHAPGNGAPPKIARFDVQPSRDLGRGNDLGFALYGTPGGRAEVRIEGVKGKFFLPEVKSGEYVGTYTIKPRDRVVSNSAVTANLLVGERLATATLGKTLLANAGPAPRAPRPCNSCGIVEAVNVVQLQGDGNYLGTIGGGVVGALLGNQVGNGNGNTAATIAGAIGGALAGRAIESNTKKTVQYEVLVRLQNGGTQTVSFAADPGYRVGEKVRVADGGLMRDL